MDTPSPSTASTTAHAVGYNDEPSITAAPLRSTDDLAVDAGQLSSLILTTEATATPQRIVESVTSLTSSGILAEGQRMPTVRDLARLLRTSPATVSSAYHALARSGILRSRGRAGTFVLRQSRTHRYDAGDLLAEAPATAPDRPIIDLSKGTPDLSLLPDIRPFLGKLGTHKAFVNSYDGPTILPMLEQILRRNWPYEPEAMTMASGAGDGLAHTMNAFVQPGDFVITEAPEYPLILDMIEAHGAMAFGVPMDGFGMLPDALDRALTMLESQRLAVPHGGHQVSMILLQPRAQNPTGASFSPQRIDALADVLLAHYPNGVGMPLIVEDDHSGDVANAYATSLAQRLPQHVVHIRSFSKSHGPDLRLAALSGPEDAVEAIIAQRRLGSDMGIAFDGDFDRCFLFDDEASFIEGYYIVGLLAEAFLQKQPGAKIIHDPRLTWNTVDIVTRSGGQPVMSKTGHAFIKERMRQEDAIYGGEMSAHHYFRDFAYCDSGMIPWLLVAELLCLKNSSLKSLVADRQAAFPASGEINRKLGNAAEAIARIRAQYEPAAAHIDTTDGISIEYPEWRFNLRTSNTEPVVRLNVESRADTALMNAKTEEILALLK